MRVYINEVGLVTDFIPSEDLNECVEALVKKPTKNFPSRAQLNPADTG